MLYLNPEDDAARQSEGQDNPYTPTPGFYDHFGDALAQQYGKAGVALENVGENVLDQFPQTSNNLFGPDWQNDREAEKDVLATANPDPRTTGWLGMHVAPLVGMALPVAAGALASPLTGGSSLAASLTTAGLMGAEGYNETKQTMLAQGVDSKSATEAAIPEGVTQGTLGLLPFGAAGGIASRIAAGGLMQAGVGLSDRYFTSEILKNNGYDAMAMQYKPLDSQALYSDLILGGFFGALHGDAHSIEERLDNLKANPPSTNDAAMVANSTTQLEIDSAPGIPRDVQTRNDHVDTIKEGTPAVIMGDRPDVSRVVDGNFVAKPVDDSFEQMLHDAFQENMEEGAQQAGFDNLDQANEFRNQKYVDVLGKHEQASSELDDLNNQLTDLQSKMSTTFAPPDIFAGRDTGITDRMNQIDTQLSSEKTSNKQRKQLTTEKQSLQDEYNKLHESFDHDKAQKEYDDMHAQHAALTKQIDQKERQINRYAGELDKRGQQLGLGRMPRPEDKDIEHGEAGNDNKEAPLVMPRPETPLTLESPEEKAAAAEAKPQEKAKPGEEAKAEETPITENDLSTEEGVQEEVQPPKASTAEEGDMAMAENILKEKTPEFLTDSNGNHVSTEDSINEANELEKKANEKNELLKAAAECGARNGI